MKKRFYIPGIFLFFGFLSGGYASNLSHGTVIVKDNAHTTIAVTHYVSPPHRAAHGYRHRYYSHELQFDTGFGAYLVIGNPGLYFYNSYYMRFYSGGWKISHRPGNPWRPAHQNDIPHKLRKHHGGTYETHHNKAPEHGYHRNGWQSSNKLNGIWRPTKKHHTPGKPMKIKHPEKDKPAIRKKYENRHQGIWY